MTVSASSQIDFQLNGVVLEAEKDTMRIDLSVPRSIFIRGEDPKTQKVKLYMLRVTNAGGLVLQ